MTCHAPSSGSAHVFEPHSGRRKNRAGQQKTKWKSGQEENLYIFFYFLPLLRFGLCAHLAVFMKNYHVFLALIRSGPPHPLHHPLFATLLAKTRPNLTPSLGPALAAIYICAYITSSVLLFALLVLGNFGV